jgi:hypothetical protein
MSRSLSRALHALTWLGVEFVVAICLLGAIGSFERPAFGQVVQQVRPGVHTTPSAPLIRGSVVTIETTRQAAATTTATMTCMGPLSVTIQSRDGSIDNPQGRIRLSFAPAASASDVRPSQCWREGGWGGGALIEPSGGVIIYQTPVYQRCMMIRSLTLRDGVVDEINTFDPYVATLFTRLGRSGQGEITIATRYAAADANGPAAYRALAPTSPPPAPAFCGTR